MKEKGFSLSFPSKFILLVLAAIYLILNLGKIRCTRFV